MRIVVQRVKEASVLANGVLTGKIGKGLLLLLGIHKEDTGEQIEWLVNKLINLRIFEDEDGKMNRSLIDVDGEVLVVSQFTLYGNCSNGRRPDFADAAGGPEAEDLYNRFNAFVKKKFKMPQTGKFGAYMEVSLINDGPVTFIIDR
ncbi:MAG: D-tyrosyl-tRNA(Tyr) deacylase [Chlamydiales bacterium]|nr:D-tyrosyl-tRNA(Tyr) deacylase [Chlamydiia bacterium]MCP5506961.1 D-tyrosyl-tRNA(Tyr) deacylase [Chlamydiales bacterium]